MKDFLHIPLRRAGRVVWLCALIPSWEGAHRLPIGPVRSTLDQIHQWTALACVERNPVRAEMVS